MNTDNFLIEESDVEFAQNICKTIENQDIRNRAVANAVAANIAKKFFDSETHSIDISSGLHNINAVLEKLDISDIYVNNSYIDVRLYFNDNELKIPKSHFDLNILPVAYMFIKISEELSDASVSGFILPESIDKSNNDDSYYNVSENDLVSFYDVESRMISQEDAYGVEDKQIFNYLDGCLDNEAGFYQALIASEEGRLKLARAAKAKTIFNFVSLTKDFDSNVNNSDVLEEVVSDDFEILETDDLSLGDDELSLELEETDNSDILEEHDISEFDLEVSDEIQEQEDGDFSLEASDELEELEQAELGLENEFGIEFEETSLDLDSDQALEMEVRDNELEDFADVTEDTDFVAVEPLEENSFGLESSFEYSTNVSPSLSSFEDDIEDGIVEETNELTIEDLEELPEANEEIEVSAEEPEEILDFINEPDDEEIIEDKENVIEDNSNQIDTLFNKGDDTTEEDNIEAEQDEFIPEKPKSSTKPLTLVALLVVLGAVGYLGYTKFMPLPSAEEEVPSNIVAEAEPVVNNDLKSPTVVKSEAMPIETVEKITKESVSNEGNAVSIPAIEQNLDASILVSNLKIDWEVPAGYVSNTSAKRYLIKLGKIIQLNLKTELLLLSKPPITNKITVEIKYNNSTKKFEAVGIKASSGEKAVDALILQTVNKALGMNLSTNSNAFEKLQGNPVLIIRL